MRITRRSLLFSLVGLLAVGAGGASGSYVVNTPEALVAMIIRRRLPDIAIEDDVLAEFARRYLAFDKQIPGHLLALLRIVSPVVFSDWLGFLIPGRARDMAEKLERRILTRFLLSTDFFDPDREKDAPVNYIAFADPWGVGCANPFADLSD